MYNVEHRFIFVEVPRTGTTSIGTALMANLPFDDSEALTGLSPDHPLAGHRRNRFHKALRHATISVLRQRPHLQGFRSFGFCRNPFSRALSWFVFGSRKGLLPSAEVRSVFADYLGHLRPSPACFDYLSEEGRLAVDRVCRFERLHEDFANICAWLGIGCLPLQHLNNSQLPAHYSEYYTPAARDLVLLHAAQDFEQFGYDTALA